MNSFRSALENGTAGKPRGPLMPEKKPSATGDHESLTSLSVNREAKRTANHRDGDRHRLSDKAVQIVHKKKVQDVTLVNVSGGGAMIDGAKGLKLWDQVDLRLAEWSRVEAAVRWIRGSRYGLEFAHETQIDAPAEERNNMLRAVILRSFPHIAGLEAALSGTPRTAISPDEQVSTVSDTSGQIERELRHPLIWSGLIHYNHESISVRLRNISSGGAMVECSHPLKVGAMLLLDFGEDVTIFACVNWLKGDAAGLTFEQPFDLQLLAKVRPEIAGERWVAPDFLRDDRTGNSPWAPHWGRADLDRLHRSLEEDGSGKLRR